jgi:hypothetical protein
MSGIDLAVGNNNNNKLFKCRKCSKTYDIPKSLPCGNTICNSCLLANDTNVLKCPFCTNDHDIPPQNGFPTNIILFQLMNIDEPIIGKNDLVPLNDLVESEFKEIDSKLKSLKESSIDLMKLKFDEIRDEIISRSEYLAKNLSEYTEIMLNDIDIYESYLIDEMKIGKNFDEKLNELKLESKTNCETLLDRAKSLNSSIEMEIVQLPSLNLIDTEKFQYEVSNVDLDSLLICKLKLHDVLKFEMMSNKINNFQTTISYKPNDAQLIYDYKNFVSALGNRKIVLGLNVKVKVANSSVASSYKLKILVFNNSGQLENEMPLEHEINEKFKQLEYLVAYRDLIYCVYIDNDLKYCLKIFDSKFQTIKDLKFNSIIKSLAISGTRIYALFNILNVNVYDLNFDKLDSFGQLVDENEPYYFEDAKEIFIQNNKIYLRHSNDKLIKILDEQTGFLLKNIEINLDNCFLQVNKLSKIVVINRLKKKLIVFDEYGKLVCENELINIQNVSSFCITSENFYIINDFPSKMTYVF